MSDAPFAPGTDPASLGLSGPCTEWDPERYEARGRIGEGAVGVVVRIRDRLLNRTLAAKIVKPEIMKRPSTLARFIAEAQVGAQLQTPGVVPIYELGRVADGRYYFTMPEIVGRSLGEILELLAQTRATEAEGRAVGDGWTLWRAVETFTRVCETVGYAHARGVVHRDLKPNNIRIGFSGAVFVLDWGIAKVGDPVDSNLRRVITTRQGLEEFATVPGTLAGTPAYMSPEQARGDGDQVEPASDVFSLGAILYEILTGNHAFRAHTAIATLTSILSGPPPHPMKVRPDLPAALADICVQALERDPRLRQRSARSLAAQLTNWLERGDAGGHHPTAPLPVVSGEAPAFDGRITAGEVPARKTSQSTEVDPATTAVDASISIETSPPATARLYQYASHDGRLVPEPVRDLGETPLRRVPCAAGSWLLILRAPGWHDAVYPIHLDDGETFVTRNPLRLAALGELETTSCLVPEGPALLGANALESVWVGGVLVQRSPVTWAQYRAFLAALGPTDAVRHTPAWVDRFSGIPRPLITWHEGVPTAAHELDALADDAPVTGLTVEDVRAWIAWHRATTRRPWRLPSADEWEKAARGVDGRQWPWGPDFDARWTHTAADWSASGPGAVMHRPFDCSPFGVMDVAGNVAELADDRTGTIVCGESWRDAGGVGPARRRALPPGERSDAIGFRIVRDY